MNPFINQLFRRIAKIPQKSSSSWNTSVLLIVGVCSSLLGLLREVQIASYFGVSTESDIYYIGLLLPELINGIIGAASANIYMRQYKIGSHKKEFTSTILLGLSVIVIILLIIFELLFPYIARIIASGLTGDSLITFIKVGRIMVVSMAVSVYLGVITGTLNINGKFFIAGLNGLIYNIILISLTYLLVPFISIYGLAWGYFGANVIRVLFLVPYTLPYLGKVNYRLFIPMIIELPKVSLTNLVLSLQVTVERNLASTINSGAVSALNYAGRICGLPSVLFVGSVLTVAFPKFINEATDNKEKLIQTVISTIKLIMICLVGVELFFIFFRVDIVNILFLKGKFSHDNAAMVAILLIYYAPVVVLSALNQVLLKLAYALGNTNLTLTSTLVSLPVYVLCAYFLSPIFGVRGLTMALIIYNITFFGTLMIGIKYSGKNRLELKVPFKQFISAIVAILIFSILFFFKIPIQNFSQLILAFGIYSFLYTFSILATDKDLRKMLYLLIGIIRKKEQVNP
jgi:putative peptidoglycan lipid II flippase